jgi:hypothetical protein
MDRSVYLVPIVSEDIASAGIGKLSISGKKPVAGISYNLFIYH